MVRIFTMYNLEPGASAKDYEDYVRRTYIPTVKALPSVCGFNLYRSLGVPVGTALFSYIEVLDINSLNEYEVDMQTGLCRGLEKEREKWIGDSATVVGEALE